MSLQTVPISELLAEREWLERLAHCLTRDGSAAKDLVQATWVHVMSRPPQVGGPVRGWLAEVMRNVRRATFRADTRRRDREVAALEAESGSSRSPEALVQEVEQRQRLISLVLHLEEPYRNVVLRHFYEGMSSVEIARRDGTPAGTVRWRLMEGLGRLRHQLDAQEHGQRTRWHRALLPIVAHQTRQLTMPWRWVGIATVVGATAIFSVARSTDSARTHAAGPPPVAAQSLRDQTVLTNGAINQVDHSHRLETAADREDCLADLLVVRTELAEAERKRQLVVDPTRLFEEGVPNDPARTILLPFIAEVLAGVDRVPTSFDLQCRSRYCRVRLLFDGSVLSRAQATQLHAKMRAHPELAARSERIGLAPGSATKDALSGAPITEGVVMLRLSRSSAAPKDAANPEPATEAELRWPSSAADCHAELGRVRALILAKKAAIDAAKHAYSVFQEAPGAAIPALEAAMATSLKRVFGAAAPSIEIYCRAGACRLRTDSRAMPDWHTKIHFDPWFRKHTRQSHNHSSGSAWASIYLALDAWPE